MSNLHLSLKYTLLDGYVGVVVGDFLEELNSSINKETLDMPQVYDNIK